MPILFRTVFVQYLYESYHTGHHTAISKVKVISTNHTHSGSIYIKNNFELTDRASGMPHPRTVTARDCNGRSTELTNNINGFDRKQFNVKLQIILQKHSFLIGFIPN